MGSSIAEHTLSEANALAGEKRDFKELKRSGDPPAGGGAGLGGKEASDRLEKAGIIVNKNTIPGETRSPVDPSGIRLGTAAETTRGKKEKDFRKIAQKIDVVLRKR